MAFVQSLTVLKIVLVQEQTLNKYLLNEWMGYPFTSVSPKSSHAFEHCFFWVLACLPVCRDVYLSEGFRHSWVPADLYPLSSHLQAHPLTVPKAIVYLVFEKTSLIVFLARLASSGMFTNTLISNYSESTLFSWTQSNSTIRLSRVSTNGLANTRHTELRTSWPATSLGRLLHSLLFSTLSALAYEN